MNDLKDSKLIEYTNKYLTIPEDIIPPKELVDAAVAVAGDKMALTKLVNRRLKEICMLPEFIAALCRLELNLTEDGLIYCKSAVLPGKTYGLPGNITAIIPAADGEEVDDKPSIAIESELMESGRVIRTLYHEFAAAPLSDTADASFLMNTDKVDSILLAASKVVAVKLGGAIIKEGFIDPDDDNPGFSLDRVGITALPEGQVKIFGALSYSFPFSVLKSI